MTNSRNFNANDDEFAVEDEFKKYILLLVAPWMVLLSTSSAGGMSALVSLSVTYRFMLL